MADDGEKKELPRAPEAAASSDVHESASGVRELDDDRILPIIQRALYEDIGPGDVTTNACVVADATIAGRIVLREKGVVCGLPVVRAVFRSVAPGAEVTAEVEDGDTVEAGTTIARVEGPARVVLTAERLALNFLGRLCGIATQTRAYVDAACGLAEVLDTRKTTPGLRYLERYAVRTGGGANHRFGLFDQVMIKDNHRRFLEQSGTSLADAIERARAAAPPRAPVEVEADSLEQALDATRAGADIVLLDNFTPEQLAEAVKQIRDMAENDGVRPPKLEASGGITLENIAAVAETGVDRISVGALTHSVRALDVALDM